MNHLNDEQLVSLLYRESEADLETLNAHLVQCSECRHRFQKLSETSNELAADLLSVPAFDIDVAAIVDSKVVGDATQLPPRTHPAPATRFSFGIVALATAVAVMIGGACFLLGSQYPSQQSAEQIREQIAIALSEANSERMTGDPDTIKKYIVALENFIAQQNEQMSENNLISLRNIESRFGQMLAEQRALRKDLQTLAVNAEGEILIARRDIQRIDEFVSLLLPINQ